MSSAPEIMWHSLGDLLTWAAAQYADAPQFIYEGDTLSFVECERRVNRLAAALHTLGIRKGERVSVMLPNGLDFPVAWLALARLGAVMVPTNIHYVEKDLHYILSDAGASAIILDSECVERLARVRSNLPDLQHVIVVGASANVGDHLTDWHDYAALMAASDDSFTPTEEIGQNDLLNIQYTSGTTGFPKGCMLTHRYWLLMGENTRRYLKLGAGDVDLTAQPFYYMDPQWNTVACMMAGIPLVIMPRFSVSRFWQVVNEHHVTFLYLIGTMPFFLMKREPDALETNHKLRMIACSGIAPDFHATFEQRFNVPWREAFGMTETGVDLVVKLEDTDSVGSGAMGKPVPGKHARIVDEDGQEKPDGEIGELVVSGEPMMLGYWNKPDKTAEAIRDGWMHTGDLAFKDEKGYFHWVGRIKDMVRRGGENIASSEVESVIIEHPAIQAAAVVPVADSLRGEEVKVYVILQAGHTPEDVPPQTIVDFAAQKLAAFKLPRYVAYVDSFPLTPSERVAKHELIKGQDDLRVNSFDIQDSIWR